MEAHLCYFNEKINSNSITRGNVSGLKVPLPFLMIYVYHIHRGESKQKQKNFTTCKLNTLIYNTIGIYFQYYSVI